MILRTQWQGSYAGRVCAGDSRFDKQYAGSGIFAWRQNAKMRFGTLQLDDRGTGNQTLICRDVSNVTRDQGDGMLETCRLKPGS